MPTVDPAVRQARRVVGLYGDPDVTWSIVLLLRLREPRTPVQVTEAAHVLLGEQPHLGRPAELVTYSANDESRVLDDFANEPYLDAGPLLRVALSDDGRSLLVAAHHGAIDGLGLLGAAARLVDEPLTSSARGIEREAEPTGFVRGSLRRLSEAIVRPPVRLAGDRAGTPGDTGDWLVAREVEAARPASAALVRAAVDLVERTNGRVRPRRVVVSMGLSRRPGSPVPAPSRDTAYVRLVAGGVASVADARVLMAATAPEPAFPVSDGGGLAPRIARLLSHRLGATVLVSNLGRVDHPAIEAVSFWPVPTGPAGVCLGLASTRSSTMLTLRVRRGWFSAAVAERLADVAAAALARAAGETPQ